MAITLSHTAVISEGSTEIVAVDLTNDLDGSEVAASATVAEVSTADLTLASLAGASGQATVSTGSLTINGETVATGKAIRWKMTGHQAGTTYRVRYTVTTDSTPARVLPRDVLLTCV